MDIHLAYTQHWAQIGSPMQESVIGRALLSLKGCACNVSPACTHAYRKVVRDKHKPGKEVGRRRAAGEAP